MPHEPLPLHDEARTAGITVVGLGECLFDRDADRLVLAGSPLNVALHAERLLAECGGRSVVASRVGQDAAGARLLEQLRAAGSSSEYVQQDPHHPTGDLQPMRSLSESQAIADQAAWGYLEYNRQLASLARSCSAVCFGTWAQRSERARSVVERFALNARNAVRLFDVRLEGGCTTDVLNSSLQLANMVKLNWNEVEACGRLLGITARSGDLDECAVALEEYYSLRAVAITGHPDGMILFRRGRRYAATHRERPDRGDPDPLDLTDACTAALIVGSALNFDLQQIVQLADLTTEFAVNRSADVAGDRPAVLEFIRQQGDERLDRSASEQDDNESPQRRSA